MRWMPRNWPSARLRRCSRSVRVFWSAGWSWHRSAHAGKGRSAHYLCLQARSAGAAARAFGHAELLQDDAQRADIGEARLEQIQADEGREGQPPRADEERAALDAEGEREQDEKPAKMRI
jgi:hypothetical protein